MMDFAEVERAYLAVNEDMILWGTPGDMERCHEDIAALLRFAYPLVGLHGETLTDAALWLLGEMRRQHPGPVPRSIFS